MLKICSKCKIPKDDKDFYKRNDRKGRPKLRRCCIACMAQINAIRYTRKAKEIIVQRIEYEANKYKNDKYFKLIRDIRRSFKSWWHDNKCSNVWRFGNYTQDELNKHLEKQFYDNPETKEKMSWSNYGKLWGVDHIIPLSFFDLTESRHLFAVWSLENLQPLWNKDNNKKSKKLPNKLIIINKIIFYPIKQFFRVKINELV